MQTKLLAITVDDLAFQPPLQYNTEDTSRFWVIPAQLSRLLAHIHQQVLALNVGLISYSLGGSLSYLSADPFYPIPSGKFYDFDIDLNYHSSADVMQLCELLVAQLNRYTAQTGMQVKELFRVEKDKAIAFAYFPNQKKIMLDIFLREFPTSSLTREEHLQRTRMFLVDRFRRTDSIFWIRPNIKDPAMIFKVLRPEEDPSRIIKRYLVYEQLIGGDQTSYDHVSRMFLSLEASQNDELLALAREVYSSPRIPAIFAQLREMLAKGLGL